MRKESECGRRSERFYVFIVGVFASILIPVTASFCQTANSCLDCHSSIDPPLKVTKEQFAQDVHEQKGLTCASCHGGNPSIEDMNAMSPAAGFRGKPTRTAIPTFCARCHSDPAYMRQFDPKLRTDQLSQYRTSIHGKRLAKGDTKVAVCSDCHTVHETRPAHDGRSKVYPLNVAATCAHCHADAAYMKEYKIPTDQFAGYNASVHHADLVQGDLSAPTCSTCHGSHGATPPGVASVELVCENCHEYQAQLFDSGPHKAAFAAAGLPGCETCHGNHRIVPPSDHMIGTGPHSFCTNCHTAGDAGYQAAATIHQQLIRLQQAIANSDDILNRAERSGMEVAEPKQKLTGAQDDLTKARVSIHSVQVARVNEDIDPGLKIAQTSFQAGQQALRERNYRRKGLGISLVIILAVLLGLWSRIRAIDRKRKSGRV
ncbi:MAG: cytochrome c3 family protein [Terriglobales bacterium]